MRRVFSGLALLILLLGTVTLAVNIQPVKAGGTVGVKAGDWIICAYTIWGWPSGTPYPEWLKVEFLSVEGTNATIRVTMHMSDGTEQNDTMTVDVAGGGGTFQGLSGFVIPANCTAGDAVYITGYGNVTIEGETTEIYAGAPRTVVDAFFSQYGTQLTYRWDKLTGVMVEASVFSGGVFATAKATETNMWQSETTYIRADGSVDPPDAPISTLDNVTYTLTGNITSDVDGIAVEKDSIVVDGAGFTVQGTGSGTGITLSGRNDVTIKNTEITTFRFGIMLEFSSGNTVSGNNITANNIDGIYLDSSSDNSVSGNNITNSVEGIYLHSSFDNTINENNITAYNLPGIYYWGIHLESSSSNSISGNNIVGNNITANNQYGIFLYSSSDSSINGNNITNNMEGIYVDYSSNVGISGNKITKNNYGMELYESNNNTLSENVMNDNTFSFGVYGWAGNPNYYLHSIDVSNLVNGKPVYYLKSQKDLVINPTAYPQIGYLALIDSTNITVEGITLTNNSQGLLLAQTSNSTIMDNNITSNDNGIRLDQSFNNTLFRNNITNNEYGIRLDYSSNNKICHNNFVNNTAQVYLYGSINAWDVGYPSGGNFWSNYNGTDLYSGPYQNETGGDGIGDTPYVIDGDNVDHYPFVNPLVIPSTALVGDLNGDGKVTLADLTLLASAYNSKPGDSNWNPMADIAPPHGIISLTDLVTMAVHYGQHYP